MDRPNVILMPVGDDDSRHLVGSFTQILIIGDDVIDPQHVIMRKHDARVHDQNLVLILVGGHVLANFPEPTQGNDLQFSVLTQGSCSSLYIKRLFFRQKAVKVYMVSLVPWERVWVLIKKTHADLLAGVTPFITCDCSRTNGVRTP